MPNCRKFYIFELSHSFHIFALKAALIAVNENNRNFLLTLKFFK